MKKVALAALLLAVAPVPRSDAGEFYISCYGTHPGCVNGVNDLVTDKFTTRYPVKDWMIVVVSGGHRYQGGERGGAAFAVVGVAPRMSSADGKDVIPILPKYRFTSTETDSEFVSASRILDMEMNVIRSGVTDMMARCDKDPKCDVHQ